MIDNPFVMKLLVVIVGLMLALSQAVVLEGSLHGIQNGFKLYKEEQVVNGNNLGLRFRVKLTLYDTLEVKRSLINNEGKFKFYDLKDGSYDMYIYSHDFDIDCDRFIIDIRDGDVLARPYYVGMANDPSEIPVQNITEKGLSVTIKDGKKYYEAHLSSLNDMIMNSPFGIIFKNKIYTGLFVFCVCMTVGPYILEWVSPEMAEKWNEAKDESRKQMQQSSAGPGLAATGQTTGQTTGQATEKLSRANMKNRRR